MANYQDLSRIGSGGFGTVWECKRTQDGRLFAKKKLDDNPSEEAITRFRREVRILSELDHPNIIKVIAKRLEDEPYFYIMPRYRCSVADELFSIAGDEDRIRMIYSSILDGIEYAHRQGVIHRDLKPENLLMNSDSDLVVSDFGLGREFNSSSLRQTFSGMGLGTPFYMAPEQLADAKHATERCDVYALGRILLDLHRGMPSFGFLDFSGIPPAVTVIIRRCMEPDPERRFRSVAELKMAFRSIYDSEVVSQQVDELNSLLATLSSTAEADEDDARDLLRLLIPRLSDADLVIDVFTKVAANVFSKIEAIDVEGLKMVIAKFVEVATSQGWPFNFTDKIGRVCKRMHDSIRDFEAKAELVYCAAEVGTSHNRFAVMELAAEMVLERKEVGEAIPLYGRLATIPDHRREVLGGYMKKGRLSPLLRPLFPKAAVLTE